jgi:adenylosuccinate lyase
MSAARAGGDRQALHEVIREHSLAAWAAVQRGEDNPLADALMSDPRITAHVSPDQARALLDASVYVGDAPERARLLTRTIRATVDGSTL